MLFAGNMINSRPNTRDNSENEAAGDKQFGETKRGGATWEEDIAKLQFS
jgi:hypothetical protein